MAVQVNPRIYEKTMLHHDFLTFSVGTGQANTSFEIQFNEEEFSQTKDELIDIARELRQRYLSLEDVPVVTDLMNESRLYWPTLFSVRAITIISCTNGFIP